MQIAFYAQLAGFRSDRRSTDSGAVASELVVAVAVALAESGGRTGVVNGIGATGLWQIYPGNPALKDPTANARAAFGKYSANGRAFGRGRANDCLWSAYCSGRYLARIPTAKAGVARFERELFGAVAGNLTEGFDTGADLLGGAFGWIDDLFTKWIVPIVKIGGGGVLMLTALGGSLGVMALGREPGVSSPISPARVARIRAASPRAPERAEQARIRARNRSELARARVSEEIRPSGKSRVRISSRSEGRRRLQEEADRAAERAEGRRRSEAPRAGEKVIPLRQGSGRAYRRRSA